MEARAIEGTVNAINEAIVAIPVLGPYGQYKEEDFVIDTGFTGFLSLTPALVTELGLTLSGTVDARLADGKEVTLIICHVYVIWDGSIERVRANALDSAPTIGMSILEYYDLIIQVREGGRVLIQAGG